MLPKTLCFIDCETTGMSSQYGRIIEVGILRVENNKVVDSFQTLINPQISVDPFIQNMTGITQKELEKAPSFYSVKDEIKKILKDGLFVAHNVLFDYSFIKKEFERLEEDFSAKYLCSVKLSRKLFPKYKHHNLDAIIKRFNFECKRRHRAYDDAKIIWDFYKTSLEKLGEAKLSKAIDIILKKPTLPIGVKVKELESLPQSSGVYLFYNKDNALLYIGKSNNIKERVMSHFSNSKKAGIDMKIAQDIERVESIETAGELGALLLEATLIKKMQPLYNRQLRYASKLLALKKVTSTQDYHSVSISELEQIEIDDLSQVLGIFKSKKQLSDSLLSLAKEYNLCPKLLGLEKTKKNCFNYHLKLCFGACKQKEGFLKYNLRFDSAFYKSKIKQWPFKGPIALKEGFKKQEVFIIDKWCVLGKLENESDSIEDISRDYLFDSDTYRILNSYLKSGNNFEVFKFN